MNDDIITEQDIDWLAEIREADEEAKAEAEARWDAMDCCGGRNWNCVHWGRI